MAKRRAYRPGQLTPVARALTYGSLILFALIYILPFVIELGSSFKTDADATANPLNPIPQHWTLAAFHELAQQDFPLWFLNSTFVSISVTLGRILFDSLAVNELNLYNTYAGMIMPLLADAAGVFIMKQFFESVPPSVEEAARIDGAGILRTFWSVVLPMGRPALITLTVLSFQGSWNELSNFIVSRQSPNLNTLTSGVASLVSGELGQGNQYPLKLAAALLMTIPVAIVFFVFQRRLVRGTEGAVKE